MTIGMFAVTTTAAAVFTSNGNGTGHKLGHVSQEPVLVVEKWKNPKKHDLDDEGRERYCDMYRAITSLGLGWLNEEEVRFVP